MARNAYMKKIKHPTQKARKKKKMLVEKRINNKRKN